MAISPRARVLLIAAISFALLAAFIWYLSTRYWSQPVTPLPLPPPGEVRDAASPAPSAATPNTNGAPPATTTPAPGASPVPDASPVPNSSPAASPAQTGGTARTESAPPPPPTAAGGERLLIPVEGIRPEQLHDTYNEARSEGRTHNAIDIIAPRGAPVLAAADGRIVKLFNSQRGGITIYQLSTDERTVYYYAHLERYADGLAEGRVAHRGETIAYVGDTGNATPGNYHLHFQVYRITDPKHFWDGENLNPYTLLRGSP